MTRVSDDTSYNELMITFEQDLENIVANIKEQEILLHDSLEQSLHGMQGGNWNMSNHIGDGSVDPTPGRVDDASDLPDIDIKQDYLKKIYTFSLPNISAVLNSAAGRANLLVDNSMWRRDPHLGTGDHGSWQQWDDVRWALRELILDLSWECDTAARTLQYIAEEFDKKDQEIADKFGSLADEIAAGSPHSASVPNPNTPPPSLPLPTYREHRPGDIGGY